MSGEVFGLHPVVWLARASLIGGTYHCSPPGNPVTRCTVLSPGDSVLSPGNPATRKRIMDYPNLSAWLRDMWQIKVDGSSLQVRWMYTVVLDSVHQFLENAFWCFACILLLHLKSWEAIVAKYATISMHKCVCDTLDIDAARHSYHSSLFPLNPSGIVPFG
eukprot:1153088-Pelagomonas_calceolata.AAC.2